MTGDRRDEFDDFVRARHERLCRVAYVLCGDWQHAEDIVQTALAKVYEVYRRRPIDDLDAYAYRAVVTTRASWWRRRWHGEVATGVLPEPAAATDSYKDVDQRRAVLAALAALPVAQREVLALRYLTDLTEADTAAALGCSIGTVKSRAHRAIAALRASGLLTDDDQEPAHA